ncbi:MAG TPA: signal peptidase I [Gemmatimonadaceae bacterium]|nr:signal peptidase I [Gemmatimonadaceae bacterium]
MASTKKRSTKPAPPAKSSAVAAARGKTKAAKRPVSTTLWENVKSIAGALVIFLFIRTFFIEAFRIPSGSMIPALLVGDWLFVNKLVYGPHIPFTDINLPGYAEPKRGEVVVFKSPYQPDEAAIGNDPTPTLVKRLVGMPGDTLYMRDGLLHVNGIPQRQGFAAEKNEKGNPNEVSELFAWQKQVALSNTRFGSAPAQPTHDNWGPLLIPPDHYFMMGDNRYCSKDSRYWGIVPRENVRGRPMFVYYSYRPGHEPQLVCAYETSDRPLPFITDVRWGRIGTRIR